MTALQQIEAIVIRLQRVRDQTPGNPLVQSATFRALAIAGSLEAKIRRQADDDALFVRDLAHATVRIEEEAKR